MATRQLDARMLLSPGLTEAPVLDRMCSQFVLTLTVRHAGRFNLRRDWNSLLSLTGRHLVWPASVLGRLRDFLKNRCKGNEHWRGHEALADEAFMARHGAWRGPYEEGTLFFYVDEYIKDAPKDLLAVLGATADWLDRSLKKESTLVQKNIDALAGLLQLNPAERALLLYGTLARYQRDLRGLLVEFKVSNAQEAYAAIAAVAGVMAHQHRRQLLADLHQVGQVGDVVLGDQVLDHADALEPRAGAQRLGHVGLADAGDAGDRRVRLLRVRDLELDQQAAQVALVARERAVQQQRALGRVQLQEPGERVDVLLDQRRFLLQAAREPVGGGPEHREQVLGRVLDVLVDVEEDGAFFIWAAPAAVARHERLVAQALVAAPAPKPARPGACRSARAGCSSRGAG